MKVFDRERNDWAIVLIILLIGFLCVIVAGQWALRFSPSWKLDTDMESNLDPNSDFLTRRPSGLIEPVDPAILTQPIWVNVFLTPGASFATGTPLPASTATVPTEPATIPVLTNTIAVTISPTNTFVYLPPASSSTPRPKEPAATATTPPSADLQITQVDGTTIYVANSILSYTVTVTNAGPDGVTGAVITDNIPAQITNWDWACAAQNIGASGCDVMNGNTNFSDTVNLPSGASIVYTVTATIPSGVSGSLSNTVSVNVPADASDPDLANNISLDTNTPGVDLVIAKNDGGTTIYSPNTWLTYTITVTNNSLFDMNGVTVADVFSPQIDNLSWSCAPAPSCTSSGTGNINDTVNMPAGSVVTYTISAHTSQYAWGTLVNTASVTTPAGFTEINAGNNSSTDSDASTTGDPVIGPPNGDPWFTLASPGTITMVISQPIVANGNGTYDFVYYERRADPATVQLDMVQVQISSDGITWHEVFNWGAGGSDTNTNVALPVGGSCLAETDNCIIPIGSLHNSTGIAIDIDSLGLSGSYPWVRIISPADLDGGCEVEAIQPFYP